MPELIIIGAGLAGLVCAKVLAERGQRDFVLLEAETEPGGRVRSRVTSDGFTLDRGFQVLLDSYPAVRRHLDLPRLRPRYFASGALLADPATGRIDVSAHPLRHPADGLVTALSDVLPFADKLRLSLMVAELLATPDEALLAETRSVHDRSTAQFLFERGFSPAVIERFLRPFFGGVFLDETLATSAGLFRYYLKKFAVGHALLPAGGIGEIPRQLAARLPAGTLRLGCPVERIETDGNHRARAVHTANGERIACGKVLLATDPPGAARLLGIGNPDDNRSDKAPLPTTVVYFSSKESLNRRPMLVLPAGRGRLVRHFVQLTNVAPEYAPNGQHLVSSTVLNRHGLEDAALFLAARAEIAAIYADAAHTLEPLAVIHIPYGQRRQPAGFARDLIPAPAPTHLENVFRLGDGTTANSIQTAMTSGEATAHAFSFPA